MSLTRELRNPHSPLARFLREHLPNTRPLADELRRWLAATSTLRPAAPLGPHSATIGTAFDWRLRYYFSSMPDRGLLPSIAAPPEWAAFLASLDATSRLLRPAGRRLGQTAEDLLNRHCVVLALREQLFRGGDSALQRSLLFIPEPRRTVPELLAIAEDHWLADLRTLSWAAYETLGDRLARPAVLNPTFAGSADVGGADADLILDDCLVEIKTTLHPRWLANWLYQLLGYVLLDYPDRFQIRAIGLYLARQRLFVTWPLDHVVATLADGAPPSLQDLRLDLLQVLKRERLGLGVEWPAPDCRGFPSGRRMTRPAARRAASAPSGCAGQQLGLPGFPEEGC